MTLRQWLADAYRTPVSLATRLPPEQCVRRIQAELAPAFSFNKPSAAKKLIGSTNGLSVYVRYRIDYRNDFRRSLNLHFVPSEGGSEAIGSFVISPVVLIFMSIFCGITGMITLAMLSAVNSGSIPLHHTSDDLLNLIPPAMFVFGLLLLAGGLAFSRSSERDALNFITQLLDATVLAAPPPKSTNPTTPSPTAPGAPPA